MIERRALFALTFTLLCGCGGANSPTSSDAPSDQPSAFAATDVSAPYAGSQYRRHHHRHHRSGAPAGAQAAAPAAAGLPFAGAFPCDDEKFAAIQREFASGALEGDQLVDVCGTVTRVLASRTTRSGLHGYYYLQVAPGDTIEIVSDLGEMDAPAWPWVKPGDSSTVRGRYYYDSASSQGIDWTHHGASRSWPNPGYVVIDGTEYR